MEDFTIHIIHSDRNLTLSHDFTSLGNQYDNKAQRLIFSRPNRYENDELVLHFFDGVTYFSPVNIGVENEFVITNALTQRNMLSLQIHFERDGNVIKHSAPAQFTLIRSMKEGTGPIEEWPDPLKKIASEAFAGVSYVGSELAFQNLLGEDVASVTIFGGGSGGTTNHAALSNLGYAQSGHTGFASAADVANKLEVSNIKAGSNVSVSVSGNDVTINSTGGGGEPGPPGEDGKSAYEIAIDNGFVGTEAEWLASLQGDQGPPGQDGLTTSVNGIEQVDGNITLTAADVGAASTSDLSAATVRITALESTVGTLNETLEARLDGEV